MKIGTVRRNRSYVVFRVVSCKNKFYPSYVESTYVGILCRTNLLVCKLDPHKWYIYVTRDFNRTLPNVCTYVLGVVRTSRDTSQINTLG